MSLEQGPDAATQGPTDLPGEGVPRARPQPQPVPRSLAGHLARGVFGFGLIGAAFALTPSLGAPALLLAPPGLVALGGCPTCWIAGMIERISAGRLQRTCGEEGCELRTRSASQTQPALQARSDSQARHAARDRSAAPAPPTAATTSGAPPYARH